MFQRKTITPLLAVICLASVVLLAGCHPEPVVHSGKLIHDNFAKIHKDMTVAEVEAILGSNDTRKLVNTEVNGISVPAEEYDWKEGETWISVIFVGGQAVNWDSQGLP